jgi:hypothetical protein
MTRTDLGGARCATSTAQGRLAETNLVGADLAEIALDFA